MLLYQTLYFVRRISCLPEGYSLFPFSTFILKNLKTTGKLKGKYNGCFCTPSLISTVNILPICFISSFLNNVNTHICVFFLNCVKASCRRSDMTLLFITPENKGTYLRNLSTIITFKKFNIDSVLLSNI